MVALQTSSAPVQKITIIPKTSKALGYTMQVKENEKYLYSKQDILNKIITFAGGWVAKEVVFNEITTGALHDIEQMTKLLRALVTQYKMIDEFGMVQLESGNNTYLGGNSQNLVSMETQKLGDRKVTEIIKEQHATAKKLLTDNRKKLDEISKHLFERETITGEEFMILLHQLEFCEGFVVFCSDLL